MKRHFMMSLKALCTGVMTLCVASLSFVSCYDDSALNAKVDELGNEVSALDARLQAVEALTAKLEALTARVDALYTLEFQVTSGNELQYSFDGGNTWVSTGIKLAKELECECEEPVAVALEDNGDSVTITIGDQSFTIEKPAEIAFEIRSGKVYFESEGTQTVGMKSTGIEDLSVISYPKGWYAEINSDGLIEVTAPNYEETQRVLDYETWEWIEPKYAAYGYVKVHACGVDGKCMVGKLLVEVSECPVVVKAYDGNAYFEVLGDYGTFYYGVSTKNSFSADIQPLLADMNSKGWSNFTNNDEGATAYIECALKDLLGSEPKDGVEYVVWALVEDPMKESFSEEDFIKTYYSNIKVSAVEDKSKNNAYNIDVTVSVEGAQSYIAVAMPFSMHGSPEDYAEQMPMYYAGGEVFGKMYTEAYSGSLLDIANGTTFSQSGLYQPNWKFYLLVMPIDGRPIDSYTAENVSIFEFETSSLVGGGSIAANAKQVTEYMGREFSYDDWQYHDKLFTLDPMTQLGVELTPSADGWKVVYAEWMSEDMWAEFGSSDASIVEFLLQGYGMLPEEVEKNFVLDVLPEQTVHFVAFYVDQDGKYGQLAKLELTSASLETSNVEVELADNTVEGNLMNTTALEVTLTPSEEVSKYKYVWLNLEWADAYASLDETQLAQKLHFSEDAYEVEASELVDGKIVIEGNEYGSYYFLAVLPYDAAGTPGAVAAVLEYGCVFQLENVITENLASEPVVTYAMPEFKDGSYGESYFWFDGGAYYSFGINVAPAAGTEVAVLLVEPSNVLDYGYDLSAKTALQKASDLWAGAITGQSYYTYYLTEETAVEPRFFYGDEDLAPVIMLSWVDAEGNYYYKEVSLANEFAGMKNTLNLAFGGAQYAFNWEAFAQMYGMAELPSVVDLGGTTPNYLMIGYSVGAMDPTYDGMWMAYVEGNFEIEPTDYTSGKVWLLQEDFGTGELSRAMYIEYSDLTATSCTFNCEDFMLVNSAGTLMTENVTVTSQFMQF